MPQTHSIRAATKNFLHYRTAVKGRPTTGFCQQDPHAVVSRSTKRNACAIAAYGQQPTEVRHVLIDYRNNNEELATKCMDRKKAFHLNARLKDTGFAWAVKTGY